MDGYVVHGGVGMARGSYARIEDGRGSLVCDWDGELGITQDGDLRDCIVRDGEWFRIEREGAWLVHRTRRTRATLTAPTPADYARSITMTPAGTTEARVLYQRSSTRGWPHSWAGAFSFR